MADATAQSLESALVAHPDDVAAHAAYADHLIERGDPRGDFMRVQLALEDGKLPAAERQQLEQRERELLDQHQSDWLGSLADHDDLEVRFARGWLDSIQVTRMRADLAELLARAPEVRLLRELAVIDPYAEPLDRQVAWDEVALMGVAMFSDEESGALEPLTEAKHLGNLRVLRLGDPEHERCDVGPGPVMKFLAHLPRLEELDLFLWELNTEEFFATDLLPRLRKLRVGGAFSYDIDALVANEHFAELRELFLEASSGHGSLQAVWLPTSDVFPFPKQPRLERLTLRFMRDLAYDCEALASSGLIGRLRSLDLQYSGLNDEAGAALAACPDLARLESLDITGNHLSEAALEQLKKTGVPLTWEPQIPEEEDQEEMEDDFDEDM